MRRGRGGEEKTAEDEDDSGITMSDDSEKPEEGATGREFKDVKKTVKLVERWVRLRKPGGVLVRADFGADWDRGHTKTEGVRISGVVAGSLAARSGFKEGDLIVAIGAKEVKAIHDIDDALATMNEDGSAFKFEAEPEGANSIGFTIRRPNTDGTYQADQGITVTWKPVKSSRVDAKWDKKENTLSVLSNHVSAFTLYFTDDLLPPGKEFHLFINNVPYKDLVDPATAPKYPKGDDDPAAADEAYRMRRARAKVEGWQPDLAFAVEDFLVSWDRRQVYGAKRTIDLTKLKAGFDQAKERGKKDDDFPARLRKAYDEYAGRAKG